MKYSLSVTQNKKVITLRIIGIVSILLALSGWLFFVRLIPESLYYSRSPKSWFNVMFLYFLVALILGIAGLIIGVKQRKTRSRVLGILGIVIPIIAIIVTLIAGFAVELSIILRTT